MLALRQVRVAAGALVLNEAAEMWQLDEMKDLHAGDPKARSRAGVARTLAQAGPWGRSWYKTAFAVGVAIHRGATGLDRSLCASPATAETAVFVMGVSKISPSDT